GMGANRKRMRRRGDWERGGRRAVGIQSRSGPVDNRPGAALIGILFNLSTALSLAAMNQHTAAMNTSMERLATGKRINRASDDPAGAMIAEPIEAELRSIDKEIERGLFDEKRYGAMEGAQSVIADLVEELNGLVVNAANRGAVGQGEREADQRQADSILQ